MKKLCVIIPIHREILTVAETISLKQCRKILHEYDVFLIFAEQLNISEYLKIYPELRQKSVEYHWLDSIENYNKMKCSKAFYELFKDYNFLLTYELDAFIFSDDWASANVFDYDYIGAPWFESKDGSYLEKIIGIGNSGFSVRNIQKCIEILIIKDKIARYWQLYKKLHLHRIFRFTIILSLFDNIWSRKGKNVYFFSFLSNEFIHEDVYWSVIVPKLFNFKLAKPEDAIKFSFEVNPSILFDRNQLVLPIGCHAWQKYDLEFWKQHIPDSI